MTARTPPAEIAPWSGEWCAGQAPQEPPSTLSKALCATKCQREGCGQGLPLVRRRGSPRRFCSASCRWQAWKARQAVAQASSGEVADAG